MCGLWYIDLFTQGSSTWLRPAIEMNAVWKPSIKKEDLA